MEKQLGVCMGRGGAGFDLFWPRPTPFAGWKFSTRKPHLIKTNRAGWVRAEQGLRGGAGILSGIYVILILFCKK
jgi:hypothetical protein